MSLAQRWKRRALALFWALVALLGMAAPGQAAELSGTIKGVVVDQATQQPLAGANLALLGLERGAIAGADGHFILSQVPVGTYRLRASMVGYQESIRPDLVVRSNRITTVTVRLAEQAVELEETVVRADFFSSEEEESVSAVNFNYEEIRRSPGSAQDLSRLVQALPSVNLNTDQRNDLIVRGGSPMENLVLVDHLEVPNINHFPTQGASGGPIGLLNVDLISEANFSAGGFSAAYGDRLSSVLEVELREGNRDEFDGEANMGMAGAGFILEGPLRRGRGSWLFTARRSYLDLIVGAIGTGAVPRYSDVQGKLSWDLAPGHKLSVLGLTGFDAIDIEPEDSDEEDDYAAVDDDQVVLGATWQWLWSARGYARTSLAYTYASYAVDVTEAGTDRLLYTNDSQEREGVLRSDHYLRLRPGSALSWGGVVRRLSPQIRLFAVADTNRLGALTPELQVRQKAEADKGGAYLSFEQTLFQRLKATLGLRYDYFEYNHEHDLAPRVGLSLSLDEKTSLNAAWGIYYQNLPVSLLVQHPDNRELENPRAIHYVLGLTRRLTPSTQLSAELYAKDYAELPYDPDDPTISVVDAFADFGSPVPGRLLGGGKAESRGFELLVQKKLAQALYGTCSYAYSAARYTDLEGVKRDRNFDNRHLFSLILGYRPSDRWELSGRWSFAGGRPYTPFDQELSAQLHKGVIRRELVNSQRYPAYHRLDLQFDYRKHYQRFNLVTFFSLLNAYNRANIYAYYWDKDHNALDRVDQWSMLPVGGFELEF